MNHDIRNLVEELFANDLHRRAAAALDSRTHSMSTWPATCWYRLPCPLPNQLTKLPETADRLDVAAAEFGVPVTTPVGRHGQFQVETLVAVESHVGRFRRAAKD